MPEGLCGLQEGLLNLLEKIHGKVQHVGKVPCKATDEISREKEIRTLRADMEKAVLIAYEKAALLRDRIYRIEGRSSGAGAEAEAGEAPDAGGGTALEEWK